MNNDLEQFSEDRLKKMTFLEGSGCVVYQANEVAALARIALSVKQAKPIGIFNQMIFDVAGSATVFSNKEALKAGFCSENGELTRNQQMLYTTPQPAHTEVNSPVIPDGWKLVPVEPTDEQLRLMLAARYPATFREHLRNPLNGPKSRVEAEMLIVEVTNQYKNALSAAPKPESE